jgi:hypothetical protein
VLQYLLQKPYALPNSPGITWPVQQIKYLLRVRQLAEIEEPSPEKHVNVYLQLIDEQLNVCSRVSSVHITVAKML